MTLVLRVLVAAPASFGFAIFATTAALNVLSHPRKKD